MSEKMYHIGLSKEDIEGATLAILPGDPGRVEKIANYMKNPRKVGQNREYTSFLAEIDGKSVLVMSTGMGGPSTAIGIEELHMLGITHCIRVGTCGGMQMPVIAGDVVVVTAAVRQDGTSKEYVPIEFPAVADLDLTLALRSAAKENGFSYHTGIVQCKDSFYGQHSPSRMPIGFELEAKWEAWKKAGVVGSEMESATLFTVCSILGMKAGAVMLCVWNQERKNKGMNDPECHDPERAILTAITAARQTLN